MISFQRALLLNKFLLTVDLTAARLTLLAKIDIGLTATEGRETVARAAVRIAVEKAREAMIYILIYIKDNEKRKEEKRMVVFSIFYSALWRRNQLKP